MLALGCARFADFCANSWRLDCFSHSITMVAFTLARCKTAKIHQNKHSPDLLPSSTNSFCDIEDYFLVLIFYSAALIELCNIEI